MNALINRLINEKQTTEEYHELLGQIWKGINTGETIWGEEEEAALQKASSDHKAAETEYETAVDNLEEVEDSAERARLSMLKAVAWDAFWKERVLFRLIDELYDIRQNCYIVKEQGEEVEESHSQAEELDEEHLFED